MSSDDVDKNNPATLGDLETWGGNLAFWMQRIEENQAEMRAEMKAESAKQQGVNESILNVLGSIEARLKVMSEAPAKVEDHEERIAVLEWHTGHPK